MNAQYEAGGRGVRRICLCFFSPTWIWSFRLALSPWRRAYSPGLSGRFTTVEEPFRLPSVARPLHYPMHSEQLESGAPPLSLSFSLSLSLSLCVFCVRDAAHLRTQLQGCIYFNKRMSSLVESPHQLTDIRGRNCENS